MNDQSVHQHITPQSSDINPLFIHRLAGNNNSCIIAPAHSAAPLTALLEFSIHACSFSTHLNLPPSTPELHYAHGKTAQQSINPHHLHNSHRPRPIPASSFF